MKKLIEDLEQEFEFIGSQKDEDRERSYIGLKRIIDTCKRTQKKLDSQICYNFVYNVDDRLKLASPKDFIEYDLKCHMSRMFIKFLYDNDIIAVTEDPKYQQTRYEVKICAMKPNIGFEA